MASTKKVLTGQQLRPKLRKFACNALGVKGDDQKALPYYLKLCRKDSETSQLPIGDIRAEYWEYIIEMGTGTSANRIQTW